jgi:hypothetical protein
LTAISLLLAIALAAPQQVPQQPAGATVEGLVVDAASGTPLKGAQVYLVARSGQPSRSVITDKTGAFEFTNLIAGDTVLTVSLDNYLGTTLTEQVAGNGSYHHRLAMTHTSSVAGRVYDSDRQPAAKVEIQLLRDAYVGMVDERSLAPINAKFAVQTNDKGEYRISGITPGDYYIRAAYAAAPARRMIGAFAPTANNIAATYYPGVTTPDAALPIKVTVGVDVQVADFPVEPLPPFKISGRIVNSLVAAPVDRYSYFLIRRDARVRDGDGLVPDVDPDIEHFEFRNIPPGSYTLYVAYRTGPGFGDPFFVGRSSIDVVDRDVTDLTVAIESGVDIAGTWTSEDPSGLKRGERGPITLQPFDGMPGVLVPEPIFHNDGTLEVSQTPPGRYLLSFVLPQKVYVATARFGPRDVIGQPFEVDANSTGPFLFELSTPGGMLYGTVTDSAGNAVAGAAVVLLPPIDLRKDQFSYKTATANARGQFSIVGIRPGSYTAFAIAERLDGYASFSMTQYLNHGTPIEVGKNQPLLQDLTLIPRQ